MRRRSLYLFSLLLATPAASVAQIISVKTIPIAQADQFQFAPARSAGMGGAGIALHDTLLDATVNPAKGARLRDTRFFSVPSLYLVKNTNDLGRSLPMGAGGGSGQSFGSFSAALQGIEGASPGTRPQVLSDARGVTAPTDNGSGSNQFAYGSAGRSLGAGLSVGISAFWAGIHAIDGVDRLYAGSQSVRQHGHALDFRVGALKEWPSTASFEAMVLHNRFVMTHDVTYSEAFFDPAIVANRTRARLETNLDHTNLWGLHVAYERPLGNAGVRVGALATANRMSHPKIPEYRLTQVVTVPWDPGHTNAFNLGVGISKVEGPARFAADVIVEPIWTHTWGEAQAALLDAGGGTIQAGGKTVENWFRFANATLKLGAEREFWDMLGLQFGLHVHAVHYHFWQNDHVQLAGREQTEGWSSVTPTWGIRMKFTEFEVVYQGRSLTGLGRPGCGCSGNRGIVDVSQSFEDSGAIVSPPSTGGVTMGDATVITHQVSVTVPLWRVAGGKAAP